MSCNEVTHKSTAQQLLEEHEGQEHGIPDQETVVLVAGHVERNLRTIEGAFCDHRPGFPHIDVFWVMPTEWDPHHHLVTCGMSALPMAVPGGRGIADRIELAMTLPGEWPVGHETIAGEHGWPLRQLLDTARIPHETGRYMSLGHVVATLPPEPFSRNTRMCGWVLTRPAHLGRGFEHLVAAGRSLAFYSLVAVHQEEIAFSFERDERALIHRLARQRVSNVLDPKRRSTVRRRAR
jgi:hypothetical protein